MTLRESEGCIVPLKLDNSSSRVKPGNAGAGKASKPFTRVHRDTYRTLCRDEGAKAGDPQRTAGA